MNMSCSLFFVSLLLANTSAFAVPAPTAGLKFEATISMSLAEEAAREAVANCATKGYQVAATVVDKAGDIKALFRADGAGPHTVDASRRKAYTAASAKNGTSAMLATSQSNPAAQNLGDIDGFLLLGGGLPIRAGSIVIGAIGVGGAPGGPLDDQCAQAGIDKIKDRIGN
ncbi:heme-binding protein [Bdellovibrio bacteriovorus]|uniref:GlcG/HbpS family heme-binding protein n=1 Tax=Bdellovibrio bacteriovorus TaxID=959 RepID=UPI0021CFCC58|nr:heme-binding protein [Bdellovibrio bacteriovorus]UXR64817.1 heme-binding protein [Bdellovibrio bacteriovorus]